MVKDEAFREMVRDMMERQAKYFRARKEVKESGDWNMVNRLLGESKLAESLVRAELSKQGKLFEDE